MITSGKKLNPFEELANLHNKGLDFVLEKLSKIKSDNLTDEQVISAICDFFMQVNGEVSPVVNSIYYAALSETINKENSKEIDTRIGDRAMGYIKSIRELDTVGEIEIIEQTLWGDSLRQSDKNNVLLYTSVAKSSIRYWSEEIRKGVESGWRKWSGRISKLPWRADADGALEGVIDCAKEGAVDALIEIITSVTLPHVGLGIKIVKIVGTGIYRSVEKYIIDARGTKAYDDAHKPVVVETTKPIEFRPGKKS